MNITEAEFVSLTKTVMEEVLPPIVKKAAQDAVDYRMAQYQQMVVANMDHEINAAIRRAVGQYFFQVEARVRATECE